LTGQRDQKKSSTEAGPSRKYSDAGINSSQEAKSEVPKRVGKATSELKLESKVFKKPGRKQGPNLPRTEVQKVFATYRPELDKRGGQRKGFLVQQFDDRRGG